ncbi:MAG TPA: hypothetical protein VGA69_07990 [Nitriliruptorales bacterium]
MSRRGPRVWLCLVAAGLSLSAAASVRTQGPSADGWWWAGRSASSPFQLEPVPEVPEDGLYVAGDVSGHSGISALRFPLGDGDRATTLTITVAEAIGTPVVDACVAAAPWEPGDDGPWEARPAADCEAGRATSELSEDGSFLTFDLGALAPSAELDLVLLPGRDPSTGQPAAFSASFAPPGADTLVVTTTTPDTPQPQPEPTGPTTRSPAPRPQPPPRSTPAPVDGGSGIAPVPPVPAAPTPLPPTTAAPAPTTQPAAPDRPVAAGSVADQGFAYPSILILPLVLLLLGSFMGWSLTRPVTVDAPGEHDG